VERRRIQKSKSTQIASSIDIGSPGTIVSSITTPSTSDGSSTINQRPKRKQQRMSSTSKQQKRCDDKAERTFYNNAHKQATKMYAEELKKENGKSATAVSKLIKANNEGVGPSETTIQKSVKNHPLQNQYHPLPNRHQKRFQLMIKIHCGYWTNATCCVMIPDARTV